MTYISREEAAKFPYILEPPQDGRAILTCAYYDHGTGDWILCLELRPGTIECGKGIEPYISDYLTSQPERDSDFEFSLGTFVFQHLSFPRVIPHFQKIETSINKLATILGTIDAIERQPFQETQQAALVAASQLEHLILQIRSIYDLLQKVVKNSAALIRDIQSPEKKVVLELPESFARGVLDGDSERSANNIADRFNLPEPLAEYYAGLARNFLLLRQIRVGIEHHGKSIPNVYVIDGDLAVPVTEEPWCNLREWRDQELRVDGRFGAYRSVAAHLVSDLLNALALFAEVYATCVKCPPALNPGLRMFMRHPFIHYLTNLEEIVRQPWRHEVGGET